MMGTSPEFPDFQCAGVLAHRLGDHYISLEAGDYANPMVELNAEQATQLRDWLSAWLERQ